MAWNRCATPLRSRTSPVCTKRARTGTQVARVLQENSFGKFNFTLDLEALQKSSDQAAHAAKAAAEAAAAAPEDKKAAAEATATAAATEAEAKTEELKKFKNLLKGIGWKGVDNRKWTVRRTGTDPIWSKPRKVHLFGSERAKIKPLNKKECLLAPSSCCLQPALRFVTRLLFCLPACLPAWARCV